jgi:hypothetical protein
LRFEGREGKGRGKRRRESELEKGLRKWGAEGREKGRGLEIKVGMGSGDLEVSGGNRDFLNDG